MVLAGVACLASHGETVLEPGKTEIVVAPDACRVVLYAAKTLSESLEKTLGAPVPVMNAFTDGKTALVLGSNDWSVAAGIDTKALKRDGFRIRTAPGRIYLVGRDDTKANMEVVVDRGSGSPLFERGTYNAVLGFLERFVGWRFYFPGELGTIVPRRDRIAVPETDLRDEPYFKVRYWSYWGMGAWHDEIPAKEWNRYKTLERVNLRMETESIPVAHGQARLAYPERFAKTHPEYFALDKDGRRLSDSAFAPGASHKASQFCYTSGVWEELYKDARSFFLKEDPSVRGVVAWNGKGYNWNQAGADTRRYFDIMPQDGLGRCQCANCAKLPERKDGQWASEVIWENTAKIANRLKAEGVPGTLVQMAYGAYRRMPDVEIPDNLAVMLAERGPWSMKMPEKLAADMKEVDQWSAKLHGNLWLWNYAGKFACFSFNLPDVPQCAPRCIGDYYRLVKDKVFGAYYETETDHFLFDYLNLYVFSRVMWDPSVDVEALLAEHDRLMFGAGAEEMGRFFRILEEVWLTKIAGRTLDTPLGPQPLVPSEFELWTDVYSPKRLDFIDGLFDRALAKTKGDVMSQKRIALMRRVMYGRFAKKARAYQKTVDAKEGLKRDAAHPERNLVPDDPTFWYRGNDFLDTETFLTPPHSFRLDGEHANLFYVFDRQPGKPQLKPNTRYRFSYYLKLQDLQPLNRGGGAGSDATTDRTRREGAFRYPDGASPFGTHDWFRQEFEFRTFDAIPTEKPYASLALRVRHAKGTAWYDGVRVEEIGPASPMETGR